jgi:transposase
VIQDRTGVLIRRVLTDGHGQRIEPLIPGKKGDKGRHGEDNRLFVDAVLWLVRVGAPWRDLPEEFGKWNSVFKTFPTMGQEGRLGATFHQARLLTIGQGSWAFRRRMPVAAKYSNFEPAISRFRGSEAELKRFRGEGGKYGQDHQTATGSDSLGALGQRLGELAEASAGSTGGYIRSGHYRRLTEWHHQSPSRARRAGIEYRTRHLPEQEALLKEK